MTSIVIYGRNGGEFVCGFLSALERLGRSCVFVSPGNFRIVPRDGAAPDFLVVSSGDKGIFRKVTPRALILASPFRESLSGSRGIIEQIAPALVVDSDDQGSAEAAKALSLETITCGMSEKNTLTFSSIEKDSAVIALQRAVRTFDGGLVEPQELPIRATMAEATRFAVLAAAAVFFMSQHTCPHQEG